MTGASAATSMALSPGPATNAIAQLALRRNSATQANLFLTIWQKPAVNADHARSGGIVPLFFP